ncbi:hypothetical protein BDQ17DRAFT_1325766 [Cyathus striatus]|nr:hypothetical protein BDQ17DRAFT_1325766 [Cyathus striatus]
MNLKLFKDTSSYHRFKRKKCVTYLKFWHIWQYLLLKQQHNGVASLEGISQKIGISDASGQKCAKNSAKIYQGSGLITLINHTLLHQLLQEKLISWLRVLGFAEVSITEFSTAALAVPSAHSATLGFVIFTSLGITHVCYHLVVYACQASQK